MLATRFHICRRHAVARAIVRACYLPASVICPLGRRGECPLEALRAAAQGNVIRIRLDP